MGDELRRQQIEELRKAGILAPEGESVLPVNFDEEQKSVVSISQTPRIDKNTGIFSCPECGQIVNPKCGNCFHSRFKGEDPLQPSDESLTDSEK